MASSIYEAIAVRYEFSPMLRLALPGGLVPGRARPDAGDAVRGTYTLVSNAVSWSTEDGFYHESGRVQFSVFGPSASAVDAAARALCTLDPDGFDRLASVALDDGTIVHAVRASGPVGPMLDDEEGPSGSRVWMSAIDYLFHCSRSL